MKVVELIRQEKKLRDDLDNLFDGATNSNKLFGKKWNVLEEKLKEWAIFINQEVKII